MRNPFFSAALAGCILCLVLLARGATGREWFRSDRRARALVGLVVFHLLTLLAVAKHPNERYMLSSLGLMLPTVLLAVDLLPSALPAQTAGRVVRATW